MKNTKPTVRSGYTLIEILVSVTLSLILMLGVTQMFSNVGDTINDTQATLNMAANLNSTAIILRNDLAAINDGLAYKAKELADNTYTGGADGYLEIIEGQGAPLSVINSTNTISSLIPSESSHTQGRHIPPYWTAYSPDDVNGNGDRTVGDNDDILAFTATTGGIYTGLINGSLETDTNAEIVWFVRGTNLYRRVLLIKNRDLGFVAQGNYRDEDVSLDFSDVANRVPDLAERSNRFGSRIRDNSFPHPVSDSWYYLRMPTLEEMIHGNYPPTVVFNDLKISGIAMSNFPTTGNVWGDSSTAYPNPNFQFWDFWNSPNDFVNATSGAPYLDPVTGSLATCVSTPRAPRAGEDIILTNVIGFDVKVWNPYWVPCYDSYPVSMDGANESPGASVSNVAWKWAPPQFVDLGQDHFYLTNNNNVTRKYPVNYQQDLTNVPTGIPAYHATDTNVAGYGFTLKGRYNTNLVSTNIRRVDPNASGTVEADKWHLAEGFPPYPASPAANTPWPGPPLACVYDSWVQQYITDDPTHLPPYVEPLTGIQVTIRCFDPRSGNIRQIRVTRFFPTP